MRCRRSSTPSSAIAEPRYRLDLRTADPTTMRPAIAAAIAAESGRLGSRLRRHELDARRCARPRRRWGSRRARRGGAPLGRPLDAGGAQPDRRRPHLDAAVLPDERSRDTLDAEGVTGEVAVVGDVMADATRLFVPLARKRCGVRAAREPGSYLVATIHREANVVQPRLGRIVDGLNRIPEPIVLPAHPRTAQRSNGKASSSGRTSRSSLRSATWSLPRSPRRLA
jgi:hypothetical protein